MKITVIYATERKSCSTTYNLAQRVINKLKGNDEVYEFFLPRDMNHFCKGCYLCFEGKAEKCGGYTQINTIKEAMNKSELIIFTAPVYVFHVPGQMKAFLDHFGYQWMVHQPNGIMFKKQALIISTAAGAGMKHAAKDIKHSLDFWGLGYVYIYKKGIMAGQWSEIAEKLKNKMGKEIDGLCEKINRNKLKEKPRIKVRLIFYGCRLMQKKSGPNPADLSYWNKQGWLDKTRPW